MRFARAVARMDRSISKCLSDCTVDHFTAAGATRASGLEAIVTASVERIDELSGAVDRMVTIACLKHAANFDRGGSFTSCSSPILGDKTWHIDGIASDDGHWVTFYVVP